MKVKELEQELKTTRAGISDLNRKLDESLGFDLELTNEIQALREHERRTSERLREVQHREAERAKERNRERLCRKYKTAVEATARQQETVERIVSSLIEEAHKLRELDRAMRGAAAECTTDGGDIPVPPVKPLWQKHGGEEYPYCDRVRRALKSL